ncbi:MAG TPA: VWA domain-containing protein [Vicinamibacterales bacterium]
MRTGIFSMRLRVLGWALSCTVGGGAVWLSAAPVPQQVFRATTDLVTVGVTVSGKNGLAVQGLSREDFEVREDGVPQPLSYLATGDSQESAPPLHLGLMFDTSGSMADDIHLARTAAIKFLNTLTEAVDITLVDFDTEVRAGRFTQADFPRLVERIRNRKPQGFTAMYDALGVYLDTSSGDDGRTVLVIFTDGGDTRSSIPFGEALTLVRASDVTVYAIGFLPRRTSGPQGEGRARLSQLTAESGGEAFFPTSMTQIEEAFARIAAQVQSQYTLGYTSTNTARDGRWRKLEVRVRRPDTRSATVRARRGYFAPFVKQ